MRIAWFTPFSRKSSIGRRSAEIMGPLSEHTEVHLWHPATTDRRETGVRTISFRDAADVAPDALRDYDLLVYNLGNYVPFHGEIYRISQKSPGVCILHDFVMHHFFWEYYVEQLKDRRAYVLTMERLYGPEGRNAAERGHVCASDEVLRFPFFEEAIRGAYGVVTHSEFLRARVERVHAAPVTRITLPCARPSGVRILTREELGVPAKNTLLVTVGHVNPNKRVHAVIEAIAARPHLSRALTYAVVGPADKIYQERLMQAVRKYGLEDVVRFLGYTSDEVLESYVEQADVCVNLRFPAMEGASGSAVEEMMHAKPLLVTNTGSFRELPDDCVLKVDSQREAEELPAALDRLIGDPDLRRRMGRHAAEFSEENCRPEQYVRKFLQFAREVRDAIPLLRLADRLACELNNIGVHCHMPVIQTVAREASALFCRGEENGDAD